MVVLAGWVPSAMNPADDASRLISGDDEGDEYKETLLLET
jgi:hypothetical protein